MASATPVSFGALLRRLRTQAGLTQEALAAASGVGVRTISDLERGLADRPRAATLAQLVAALRLAPEAQAALESAARQLRRAGTPAPMPAAAATPLAPPLAPPLVGRAVELAAIEQVLAGSALGVAGQSPPALLLAGEPGMGKSRLLAEAARRGQAQGWMVLAGGCTRRSGQEPYAPLLGAFARCLAALPSAALRPALEGCAWLVRLLPELAERMPAPTPAPTWTLPPEQERRLMYAAAGRVLANLAGPAGTLLVLDDLQWAGEDALDLLAALLRAGTTPEGSLRVLGAYRATEVPATHPLAALLADLAREGLAVPPLALGPLAPTAARELVASLLTAAASTLEEAAAQTPTTTPTQTPMTTPTTAQVAERLLERGGGVPFFLISCAQAAAQGDGAELPWTVQQSVRQRVVALPAPTQALLGLAAVAGREVPRRVLLAAAAGALGMERAALLAALDVACQVGLLVEDGQGDYRFAHDLIREVVLADLGAARRVAWHLAWAEALERRPEDERWAAELAWHFAQADEPAWALPYALAAGDQAEAAYAHVEAERYYHMSAELAQGIGDAEVETEALEKAGAIFDIQGRSDEAIHSFEQAASQRRAAGDREGLAWVTSLLARACDRSGRQEQGIEHLRNALIWLTPDEPLPSPDTPLDLADPRAERALGTLSARLAARLGTSLGNYLLRLERPGDAHVILTRAIERAHVSGDHKFEATAHLIRAFALLDLDRVRETEADLEEAARLAESAADLDILSVALIDLAVMQVYRADLAPAIRNASRGSQVAEQLGDPGYTEAGAVALSEVAFIQGNWLQARAHLERARDILRRTAPHVAPYVLMAVSSRLDLLWDGGEQSIVALERLAQATSPASRTIPDHHRLVLTILAESELLSGRAGTAYSRLEPLFALSEATASLSPTLIGTSLFPLLAWAIAERGNAPRADELLSAVVERARQLGYRPTLADALRVQALLATRQERWREAESALEESLALCQAMPYPYAEAKALYVYGQFHAAKGEPARARERFEQALAILHRLGERLYAAHVAQALGARGT